MHPFSSSRRALAALSVIALIALLAYGCSDQGEPLAEQSSPVSVKDLPWVAQPDGSPSIGKVAPAASLVFPVGVSYPDALRSLYVSASENGTTPPEARVAAPLPAEVVVVQPESPDEGIRLSLTAPWGWTPDSRLVRPPSIALPPGLSKEEYSRRIDEARAAGMALPEGAEVDVPQLEPCMIAHGPDLERPACD